MMNVHVSSESIFHIIILHSSCAQNMIQQAQYVNHLVQYYCQYLNLHNSRQTLISYHVNALHYVCYTMSKLVMIVRG